MPASILAVVFDFDGVLAHTEPLHLASFREAFDSEGWALSDEAYYQRYLGFNDRETISEFERDHQITPSAERTRTMLDRKAAAYRRRIAVDNVLYPGAAACVARLAAAFPLAIASGSLHAEIDAVLAVAELRAPFSVVVGADDVSRGKPAPDPYLAAAAALGIAPQACVAIEDSSWGIDSARAAGMYTIAVTTTAPVANLAGANRVVHSLDEISVPFVRALASGARA